MQEGKGPERLEMKGIKKGKLGRKGRGEWIDRRWSETRRQKKKRKKGRRIRNG